MMWPKLPSLARCDESWQHVGDELSGRARHTSVKTDIMQTNLQTKTKMGCFFFGSTWVKYQQVSKATIKPSIK